jgi:DNA adenine methylase
MKIAPVLKYPGAKWSLASWIIEHMPPHTTYLEPFFGSGAVFFNKRPSKVETINDIDGNVVNLFRVIRERPEELARLIEFTPWARDEYYASYEQTGDPLEGARRFLVRCWQAHGTRLGNRTGWRHNIQGPNGGLNGWNNLPKSIIKIAKRFDGVQIESQPAVEIIGRHNFENVLIYADPPYVWETRTDRDRGRKMYHHEMTDQEHIELLDALDAHSGPVLLSGYACPLYDERLSKWDRHSCKAQAECGQTRIEVLWLNQVAADGLAQQSLFKEARL